MNKKELIIITCIIVVLFSIGIFFSYKFAKNIENDNNNLITKNTERVDSLQSILDTLKTKNVYLENKIDSSKSTIKITKNYYEKKESIILSQSVDSDIVFFSDYLSKNSK